jgi:hypothetical protein
MIQFPTSQEIVDKMNQYLEDNPRPGPKPNVQLIADTWISVTYQELQKAIQWTHWSKTQYPGTVSVNLYSLYGNKDSCHWKYRCPQTHQEKRWFHKILEWFPVFQVIVTGNNATRKLTEVKIMTDINQLLKDYKLSGAQLIRRQAGLDSAASAQECFLELCELTQTLGKYGKPLAVVTPVNPTSMLNFWLDGESRLSETSVDLDDLENTPKNKRTLEQNTIQKVRKNFMRMQTLLTLSYQMDLQARRTQKMTYLIKQGLTVQEAQTLALKQIPELEPFSEDWIDYVQSLPDTHQWELIVTVSDNPFDREYHSGINVQGQPKLIRHAALGYHKMYDITKSAPMFYSEVLKQAHHQGFSSETGYFLQEYAENADKLYKQLIPLVLEREGHKISGNTEHQQQQAKKMLKLYVNAILFGARKNEQEHKKINYQSALAEIFNCNILRKELNKNTWLAGIISEVLECARVIQISEFLPEFQEDLAILREYQKTDNNGKPVRMSAGARMSYLYYRAEKKIRDTFLQSGCVDPAIKPPVLLQLHDGVIMATQSSNVISEEQIKNWSNQLGQSGVNKQFGHDRDIYKWNPEADFKPFRTYTDSLTDSEQQLQEHHQRMEQAEREARQYALARAQAPELTGIIETSDQAYGKPKSNTHWDLMSENKPDARQQEVMKLLISDYVKRIIPLSLSNQTDQIHTLIDQACTEATELNIPNHRVQHLKTILETQAKV